MPAKKPDPEQAMQKLDQHAREDAAKEHAMSEKDFESVKQAVREE